MVTVITFVEAFLMLKGMEAIGVDKKIRKVVHSIQNSIEQTRKDRAGEYSGKEKDEK